MMWKPPGTLSGVWTGSNMTGLYKLAMGRWGCGLGVVSRGRAKDRVVGLAAETVELAPAVGSGAPTPDHGTGEKTEAVEA